MTVNRCPHCMEELGEGRFCPGCGRDVENLPNNPFALRVGSILRGKYLIGDVLGQGGFGITYIGWDLGLETKVAVKEYFPMGQVMRDSSGSGYLSYNPSQLNELQWKQGCDGFLKEARKMARIKTFPSIVRVVDVFNENNTAYIVMDYVEGTTLKSLLEKNGPMSFKSCVDMLLPLIDGLSEIHAQGLIHRDISPDNIMIQPDGQLRLLDLGAAKDLGSGSVSLSTGVIKQGFSPIEQYSTTGQIGSWTDVYAMCATIYYCVTGKLIPNAPDRLDEDTLTIGPGFTEAQRQVITRGLGVLKQNRIQSMSELSRLLKNSIIPGAKPEAAPEPYTSDTKTQPDSGIRSSSSQTAPSLKKSGANPKIGFVIAGAAALVLVILLGSLAKGPSSRREAPEPSPSEEVMLDVPSPLPLEPDQSQEPEQEPEVAPKPGEDWPSVAALGCSNVDSDEFSNFIRLGSDFCALDADFNLFFINSDTYGTLPSTTGSMHVNGYTFRQLNKGGRYVYFIYRESDSSSDHVGRIDGESNGLVVEELFPGSSYCNNLRYVRLDDNRELLYYTADGIMYRFDINSGEQELLDSSGDVMWINFYEKYLYYMVRTGDVDSIELRRSDLNGGNMQVLSSGMGYYSGFIEDGRMYLRTPNVDGLAVCDLDGVSLNSPLEENYVLGSSCIGYRDGWLYYIPWMKDNDIVWRVSADGGEAEMLCDLGAKEMALYESYVYAMDGFLAVVTGDGPVYIMNMDGSNVQQLKLVPFII